MKILVIEDDPAVANFLKKAFEEIGWSLEIIKDGSAALEAVQAFSFDMIVLDLLLPRLHGLQVLEKLRGAGVITPVIILTALEDTENIVRGLNLGADDYMVKPFSFAELHARILAILRRGRDMAPSVLKVSDLVLDPARHKVWRGGKEIELTQKEFALLEYFMRHEGQILTRVMILEHVWDYRFDTMTNLVDVHIYKLRNKVDRGFTPKLIKTIKGVGYVMEG